MQKCPSREAHSHLASQEISRLLWNLKFRCPPLVPILSQWHSVHTYSHNFPKIHSNFNFPSMPRSSKWSLPFRFSNQNIICISHISHACYMSLPSHSPSWFISATFICNIFKYGGYWTKGTIFSDLKQCATVCDTAEATIDVHLFFSAVGKISQNDFNLNPYWTSFH